ncbi:efflux RND transporter periplasmic adaptor subunit [Sodaliphilus sp.]|uniref:efflux RND transporter periplasmic adaptor subunit n=1 Tax=Sodaliphilus sp. TaxID=2815818 RepID=UPI00388CEF3D
MKTKQFMLLAMAATMLAACTGKDDKKGQEEELPMVKVQSVYQETVTLTSEYTATVEAFKTNNIASNNGNRIKRILVDVGSTVRAGQSVVVLDDVNIATQQASIDQQRIQLANQKRDLDRAKELVKIGGGTQQAVDQLQATYDAQARAIQSSQRMLSTMGENTVLTSPVSGVVTEKNYNNGDLPAGLPILVIEQQQPLKVIVNVNESDFPKVKQDMPVVVKLDTYGDEEFAGKVYLIHPSIDPASRTFQVEVTIANTSNKIHSGMFARVTFNFGSQQSVVVPDQAVQKQTGSGVRYVYVYNTNGTVKFAQVELGRRLGNRYEILSGLPNGAQVVVSGQSRLSDGAKVKLDNSK